MTIEELIAFVKRLLAEETPKADIFDFLDSIAEKHPDLAPAVIFVESLLGPLFDQGNITDTFTKAVEEVMSLFKSKYGPVSDAPEIGLV